MPASAYSSRNHAVRGVLVPAGLGTVEFRYESASLALGVKFGDTGGHNLLSWVMLCAKRTHNHMSYYAQWTDIVIGYGLGARHLVVATAKERAARAKSMPKIDSIRPVLLS